MTHNPPLLLAAGLAALVLAGCGGDQEESAQSAESGPDKSAQMDTTNAQAGADNGTGNAGGSETGAIDRDTTEETASAQEGEDSGAERDGATPGDGADTAEAGTQTDTGETEVPPGKTAAQSLGCTSCHQADAQLVGPPYRAVAQRYDGDKATILKRMQTAVNQGAQGNWSEVTQGAPMPPQPQAADREAKLEQVAAWIAGMAE